MGWRDQLRPGSFRGVAFKATSADGDIGRRVALHEYPGKDKPYPEDMGRKARHFPLEIFVFGADYMAARDALINAFETAGAGELIHPWLGAMRVVATDVKGPKESTTEGGMARFSVTFVEEGLKQFPTAKIDTQKEVNTKADAVSAVAQSSFAKKFTVDKKPSWLSDHANALTQKVLKQIDDIKKMLPTTPSTLTGFVNDLKKITASTASLIRMPADLAADLYGLVADIAILPDQISRAFAAYGQLWDAFSGEPTINRTTSNRIAQADNQAALTVLVRTAAIAESGRTTAAMTYDSSDAAIAMRSTMTDTIEGILGDLDDDNYAAMIELKAAVINDLTIRGATLPRIIQVTPAETVSALELAYRIYGDATKADDIIARNGIRHPGFITGGRTIEVLSNA